MSADNRAVVLRWFEEVWNQQRSETVDELLDEESVCYSELGQLRGISGFRDQMYAPLIQAFPDLRVTVDGIVDDDHQVVVRWTAKGTHTGDGLAIPPTQQPLEFSGISWIGVRDGKLQEGWQHSNFAEVMRSSGAAPIPTG